MNTYTLTHKTVANLKEGDHLSLKNEARAWDVYSIGDEFMLNLKDSVTGQDNFAEAEEYFGWTVTTKEEAPDPFNSGISPLDKTRQYLLKVREQKARISRMEAQLAKEKAEAEEYTVAFLRNHYEEMVVEKWIELEPGVLGYLPLWEDEMPDPCFEEFISR